MIDVNHLCPGCMDYWQNTDSPCPKCGFSWTEKNTDTKVLPPFSILAGRYLLGTRIGSGGFGITYIAMDLVEEKTVAIKEFFPGSLAKREDNDVIPVSAEEGRYFWEALRSFQQEADILSLFQGIEGIVSYQDFVKENGTYYLVMEYISGITLMKHMRQTGTCFTETEALDLMKPILLAIQKMHEAGIIHRDISPENLILKPDGTLTLIDFGAARKFALNDDENLTVILKHGYAPEEQYHSGSKQGPWTDLYACCAVFYQMVSGIMPQDAASRRQMDDLYPLDEIDGVQVSETFARAIEKGMTIYASERYSSIKSLMGDIYSSDECDKYQTSSETEKILESEIITESKDENNSDADNPLETISDSNKWDTPEDKTLQKSISENEHPQSKISAENKKGKLFVAGALGILVLAVISLVVIKSHVGELFKSSASSASNELQTDLEKIGNVQADGSIWLPTEKWCASYSFTSDSDGNCEIEDWVSLDLKESYTYDFREDGSATITTSFDSDNYYDSTVNYDSDGMRTSYESYDDYTGNLLRTDFDTIGTFTLYNEDDEELLGLSIYYSLYSGYQYAGETTINKIDGKIYSIESNRINPETGSGTPTYTSSLTYKYEDDGSYIIHENAEDRTLESYITAKSEYDSDNHLVYQHTYQTYPDNKYNLTEIQNTYNEYGDLTRQIIYTETENPQTGNSSDEYITNFNYEYTEDNTVSRVTREPENGEIEITEYTYDEWNNEIIIYTWIDTTPAGCGRDCTLYYNIYEEYVLEDGVYIPTGQTSDTHYFDNRSLPLQHIPNVVMDTGEIKTNSHNDEMQEAYDSALVQAQRTEDLLVMLEENGISADSLKNSVFYKSEDVVMNALIAGEIDCVLDAEITNYEGALEEYFVVLPPEDWYIDDYSFESILCVDPDVGIKITELLYENGFHSENSDEFKFLEILYASTSSEEPEMYCNCLDYCSYLLYKQYIEWCSERYGGSYELTCESTGDYFTIP